MRFFALFLFALFVTLMLKGGCSFAQKDVAKDCVRVCDDISTDADYAVREGWFTYRCICKRRPEQAPTVPRT